MDFKAEISKLKTIFIDTDPIIYYIEGHNQFGKFSKEVVDAFQKGLINNLFFCDNNNRSLA